MAHSGREYSELPTDVIDRPASPGVGKLMGEVLTREYCRIRQSRRPPVLTAVGWRQPLGLAIWILTLLRNEPENWIEPAQTPSSPKLCSTVGVNRGFPTAPTHRSRSLSDCGLGENTFKVSANIHTRDIQTHIKDMALRDVHIRQPTRIVIQQLLEYLRTQCHFPALLGTEVVV